MKQNIKKIAKYILLLFLLVQGYKAFYPKTYHVPASEKVANTEFWNLKTGSKIAYYLIPAVGVKKATPIIFLQGGPGGFFSERNIESLKPLSEEGYEVYLYDQIGSGQSARLENIEEYTVERHVKDLEEVIHSIGAEKVILLGQSWGAILATRFIALHNDKVEKIILTGAPAIFPMRSELADIAPPDSIKLKNPMSTNREANDKVNTLRSKTVANWATIFGEKLASDTEMDDFQTELNQELNKSVVCDINKSIKAIGGGGFYAHVMTIQSLEKVDDIRPKLKGNPTPILLMKGQCDNQKWGFLTEYLSLFPNHQLAIIPDAGHSIPIEQPEKYIQTIKNFLNQK